MYYSGYDPRTLKPVYSAKTSEDKKLQRALLQAHIPENRYAVMDALKKAGREDLIGSAPGCIITARAGDRAHKSKQSGKSDNKAQNGAKGKKSATNKKTAAKGAKPAGKTARTPAAANRYAAKSDTGSQKGRRK